MNKIEEGVYELVNLPSGVSIMIHMEKSICSDARRHVHITKDGNTCACISLESYNEYYERCTINHTRLIELSPLVLNEIYQWMISKPTDLDGLEYDNNYEWVVNLWNKMRMELDGRELYMSRLRKLKYDISEIPDYKNISRDNFRKREFNECHTERDICGEYEFMSHRESPNPNRFPHIHIIKNGRTILAVPMTKQISPCCYRHSGEDISLEERQKIAKDLFYEKDNKIFYNLIASDGWYCQNYEPINELDNTTGIEREALPEVLKYFKGGKNNVVS